MTADILFVIDSTGSMSKVIQAAHEKAENIASSLRIDFPDYDFRFGCVCYRDNFKDKSDENEVFQLSDNAEDLALFLDNVEAKGGGGDGPEDWVSAINDALDLDWGDEIKIIIWIADASAHGKKFGGNDNYPQEEEKLTGLIEKLAKDNFEVTGIAINKYANKCFTEFKKIYEKNSGRKCDIIEFNPDETTIENLLPDVVITTMTRIISDPSRPTTRTTAKDATTTTTATTAKDTTTTLKTTTKH